MIITHLRYFGFYQFISAWYSWKGLDIYLSNPFMHSLYIFIGVMVTIFFFLLYIFWLGYEDNLSLINVWKRQINISQWHLMIRSVCDHDLISPSYRNVEIYNRRHVSFIFCVKQWWDPGFREHIAVFSHGSVTNRVIS